MRFHNDYRYVSWIRGWYCSVYAEAQTYKARPGLCFNQKGVTMEDKRPETEEEARVRREKAKEEQRKADNEEVKRIYGLNPRSKK